MVFETEKFENILVECIGSRNVHQFQYILDELRINPNKKLKCFDGLSTFEKILMMPDSRNFIEICIHSGCDFYKKNSDGIYPLRYAIDSFCADNLIAILKPFEESFTPLCDDHFVVTQYATIINEKFDGGNNYLHLLSNNVTAENYVELSQMIKAMLVNGCNVNYPNEKHETPFYLLLKNPFVENSLINFIVDNTRIEYHAHNSDDIGIMMTDRGLQTPMSKRIEFLVDTNYMAQHLGDWSALQLIDNIELWKKNSKDLDDALKQLLEVAIVKNLPETVGILMAHGVDINGISDESKFKMTPGFVASMFGHHQVLKVLLSDRSLSFESTKLQRNLLHQLFSSEFIDSNDRQKSFDLIISDQRCTLDIMNQADSENRVPLFFACQFGCDHIVMELLRRGAYIGYEAVLNYIKKDTLAEFLDECVKCSSDISDRDCEIYIDYKFLMPPDGKKLVNEITPAHLICANSNLKDFILHPVIASFVLLKWRKIDFIVYFNLLVYFGFIIFLGYIIVNFYNLSGKFKYDEEYYRIASVYHDELFAVKLNEYVFESNSLKYHNTSNSITHLLFDNLDAIKRLYDKDFDHSGKFSEWEDVQKDEEWKTRFRQHFSEHALSYWFGIFGLVLMTAYEVVQCAMSYKTYFLKPINWLDILLIVFSFFVLIKNVDVGRDSFKQICAIMILLMGAQSIQLFSKVSAFSLSLHMAILSKVCQTFLKTIAPYLIIISAFGMSFFALNYDEPVLNSTVSVEDKGFSNPFLSTISTVRMMLSDFGAVTIKKEDHFQGILFLAFMISISIVLFNLLNALAISDTNEMMEVAEFVEIKKRISTVRSYETLYSFFKVTYAKVFPKLATIMLTPNQHNAIKVKQKVRLLDNVTILMQKTGKVSNFEYLYSDWILWKKQPEPLTFDEKLINKIMVFVEKQQQKGLQDRDKNLNSQELYAIRVAQEDIYKELLKIASSHNSKN